MFVENTEFYLFANFLLILTLILILNLVLTLTLSPTQTLNLALNLIRLLQSSAKFRAKNSVFSTLLPYSLSCLGLKYKQKSITLCLVSWRVFHKSHSAIKEKSFWFQLLFGKRN